MPPETAPGPDDDDGLDFDDSPECTMCGGEPWAMECDDPLQCTSGNRAGGICQGGHCDACSSTGLAKYQVIW